MKKDPKIAVAKDDLYVVSGNLPLDKQVIGLGKDNESEKWIIGIDFVIGKLYALCCCVKSENILFCDGSHSEVDLMMVMNPKVELVSGNLIFVNMMFL